MHQFNINLNELSHRRKRKFHTWGCVALLVLTVTALAFKPLRQHVGPKFWIATGLLTAYLAAYIYFARTAARAQLYIKCDDYALKYKFGMLTKSARVIIWDVIAHVKFGPAYVLFYKRNGKKKNMRIGWLPYNKVVDIKNKIEQVCKEKGIPYEFSKYNKAKTPIK